MISGQMFFYKDRKKSLLEIIKRLIELYQVENIKYVLVHPDSLSKMQVIDNIKIKPKRGVLPNHFWFISENNIENRPEYGNFGK
jgi:hypothetical protein